MVKEIKLQPLDDTLSSNKKQKIKCLLCGDIFSAIVKGKVANYKKHGIAGCKACTTKQRYADSRSNNIDLIEHKFEIIHPPREELKSLTRDAIVEVKNKECGHTFEARWDNLKNELSNCPTCNDIAKAKRCRSFNEERHSVAQLSKSAWDAYKSKVYQYTRASYKKHKSLINPDNLPRTVSGKKGYHLDHIASIKNCFEWGVPPDKCGDYRNLRMIAWKENSSKKSISLENIPEIIYPYIESTSSDFITEMQSKLPNPTEKYKDFGGRFGLTLYSEELKRGIYYAEFYRCSEIPLQSKKYFYKMKKYFEDLGIETLIIFEDEWLFKKEMVQNKILHFLNESQKQKLYARKCNIRLIDNKDKNEFLKSNHIQGASISQVNLGAYYHDELVAVMTFTKPRKQMGYDDSSDDMMELSRFAVSQGKRVIGIASKMVAKFHKLYPSVKIFSFADLRWSSGKLYEAIGFKKEKVIPPSYSYIINGKRKHRWGYRKSMIKQRLPEVYDAHLTEIEMMHNAGYDRIWDAGYIKYIK